MSSWLSRLLPGGGPARDLPEALRTALERWQALPAADLDARHADTRYVVVNTEATGLDLGRDRLLAVAAIAVEDGLIDPRKTFYRPLETDPGAALAALLEFAAKSPLVVFNAAFNRQALLSAFDSHLGLAPELAWLDLYWLMPAYFQAHHPLPVRLGQWMQTLGIETFQRHHALGDAYAIAQLLLPMLSRAAAQGQRSARALIEQETARRRLMQVG